MVDKPLSYVDIMVNKVAQIKTKIHLKSGASVFSDLIPIHL